MRRAERGSCSRPSLKTDGADGPSRHQCAIVRVRSTCKKEPPTMDITRIGLDTAKSIFQVHGVDETGKAIMKRKLQRCEMLRFFERLEPCTIYLEACGAGHHWARVLI